MRSLFLPCQQEYYSVHPKRGLHILSMYPFNNRGSGLGSLAMDDSGSAMLWTVGPPTTPFCSWQTELSAFQCLILKDGNVRLIKYLKNKTCIERECRETKDNSQRKFSK